MNPCVKILLDNSAFFVEKMLSCRQDEAVMLMMALIGASNLDGVTP
jgi:hypothetical protein